MRVGVRLRVRANMGVSVRMGLSATVTRASVRASVPNLALGHVHFEQDAPRMHPMQLADS